ncbi:MAG: oligosaccharide flippase family protein [Candidatus Atribacteria bacterium]
MTFINNIRNKFINIIGKENIEFISHTKNYLSAGIFTRALSFISVPIFTRLLLPNEYGILAIFSSITSIFAILLGFNIHGAVARYYYEKSNDFAEFLGSNLLLILFFNFFAISLIYLIKDSIANFFVIIPYLFLIAILISAFTIPCNMYLAYLQASKQSKKFSLISINKGILSLIVSIIWVYLLKENRYYGKVYSSLLITTVFAVYMIYNLVKLSKFNSKLEYIKYSIRFGVPLIPHAFSGFILAFFDRIIINQLCGSLYTGLYSFAYNVGMVMNIVVMAMNMSWVPIFYENLANKNFKKINNLAYNYSKYIYFAAIGFILFSKEIVSLMAAKKYHTALPIVPIIVIGYVGVFLYTLYGNYSFYRKKTGLISLTTLFAGGINIGLNYWLIPIYGYVAAAYTTLVSYFLLFLFHFLNVKYILKEKNIISIGRVLLNFGWIILAVLVFILTNSYINIFVISLIIKVLFVACIGWMFFIKDKK